MDPCSSVIDEFVASESAPGELLMLPLDDLRTSVKWLVFQTRYRQPAHASYSWLFSIRERDFAVNARLLGLPLYVNISLAFFPFLNSVRDQQESSIGKSSFLQTSLGFIYLAQRHCIMQMVESCFLCKASFWTCCVMLQLIDHSPTLTFVEGSGPQLTR
jgi:hypothetical protein